MNINSEKKHLLYVRDNKFMVTIYFAMILNMFLIFGPVSLLVKNASFSLFFIIFFNGLIILSIIKNTDKTKPRFLSINDDYIKFIFWDKHEEEIPISTIKQIEIYGKASKGFAGFMNFKLENSEIKVPLEIAKTVIETVKSLNGKTEIKYLGGNIEEIVNANLTGKPYGSILNKIMPWVFVVIFFILGIILNVQLFTH